MYETENHEPQPSPSLPSEEEANSEEADLNTAEQVLSAETTPEGCEHLGDGFDSLDHYFRTELEEFVGPPIRWLLDSVDWPKIRAQFEADRYRYFWAGGSVYRLTIPDESLA